MEDIKFYFLLFIEIVFSPILYVYNIMKSKFSNSREKHKYRKPVKTNEVDVFIHEWGGYSMKRNKHVNKLPPFDCGLFYQLKRFEAEKKVLNLKITVTISDAEKCDENEKLFISKSCDRLIYVSNDGMDFSGYSTAWEISKNLPNRYIVLTNSSINKMQSMFLSKYIDCMESDSSIGALGISFNTKYYCSLIRNNFNPHIQSFFILTTIDVLNEIVSFNGGKFPGKGIKNKYLLIRRGEVSLSNIILKLGYCLGAVMENGKVFKFDKSTKLKEFPAVDYRLFCKNPNCINPIKA